ncbi:GEVED domain-containing protein [Fulvivirga maritima]|uniref:T9SS type A sorting domain-containing protein n=1 Tax=Fulvivirga maritima TaxID=2904247 RepID=UPI001F246B48|nr:T9SS type A sorting domain-containing protein [Fulvivirga maritima]UII27499.1 GEVED domain-containing protein [Fulvivirga maritima]
MFFTFLTAEAQIEDYSFSVGDEFLLRNSDRSFFTEGAPWRIFIDEVTDIEENAVTGVGYDIGFPFYFSGNYFDRFALSSNGYIKLGTSQEPFSIPTSFDSVFSSNSSSLFDNMIALGRISTSYYPDYNSISISTFGFPGEKTSIIGIGYQDGASLKGISCQIELSEIDQSFRLAYSALQRYGILTEIQFLTIGFRGDTVNKVSLLKIQEDTNTWATPQIVDDLNAVCELNENVFILPNDNEITGWSYNFTPPSGIIPPCSKPFYLITYKGFPEAQSTRFLDDPNQIGYFNLLDGFAQAPTTNLTVAWAEASEHDATYDILLGVSGQAPDTLSLNLASREINLPQLLPDTEYTIERIAKDSDGNVLYSCQASFSTQLYQDYCQPRPLIGGNEYINHIRINTLEYNRNAEDEILTLLPEERYTTTLKANETYTFNFTNSVLNGNLYKYNVWVHIDLNRDGNWDHETESFLMGTTAYNDRSLSNTITIPENVIPGKTRMRIKLTNSASTTPGANEACGNDLFGGGRQDYIITLEAPESCNGLAVSNTSQNASCINASNGSITLNPTGGSGDFSYSWTRNGTSFNANTQQISNLEPGNYQAWVEDVNTGCQVQTALIGITQPYPLSFSSQIISPQCADSETGSIQIYPTGGTTPYSLSIIQNGQLLYQVNSYDTLSQDQLLAGSYELILTDANDCEISQTIMIEDQLQPLQCSYTIEDADGQTKRIFINCEGGTPPYQFEWEDPAILGQEVILTPGSYNVNIADSQGCNTTIENIEIPTITSTENPVLSDLQIYPNPTENNLWIKSNEDKSMNISIMSSTGKTISEHHLELKAHEPYLLDVSGLESGVYVIKILDNEKNQIVKMMKSL